jgi:hypothetical protein
MATGARPAAAGALSDADTRAAVAALVVDPPAAAFAQRDTAYADPPYNAQVFGLHSFVPAKGATPDAQGYFGMMKCRGVFETNEQAAAHAEHLVRYVDSAHSIQTCYVGRPFPLCADARKFASDVAEVDLQKKTAEVMETARRAKQEEEATVVRDIKAREKKLLAESKEDFVADPEDQYAVLLQKRAQLIFTYVNTMKRLEDEVKPSLVRTRAALAEMDTTDPGLRGKAYARYMAARVESGLDESKIAEGDNFTKYLMEDVDLGF